MARRRNAQRSSYTAALIFLLGLFCLISLNGQQCGSRLWRQQIPQPYLPGYPVIVELYYQTWEILFTYLKSGNSDNGLVSKYLNPENEIFIQQAPTTQIALFGVYGSAILPIMESLDNFYLKQRSDGFISRIYNAITGDYLHTPSVVEPMVNPPLFSWAELRYYQLTGRKERLYRWRPTLENYFEWLNKSCAGDGEAFGLYYNSILGTQMNNSPRVANELGGGVDISSQMALFARDLAEIARICGDSTAARRYQQKYYQIRLTVQNRLWFDGDRFFYDMNTQGIFQRTKVSSGFWPLLAGIATQAQVEALVSHLQEPREFARPHLYPCLAANEPEYVRSGAYWRGSVWGDQVYMIVEGLKRYGWYELANQAAWNHIINIARVWEQFEADTSLVESVDRGKVKRTIWEAYSPEKEEPATRWDAKFYCRPGYVASSGFGPVAMLIEDILGFTAWAPRDELTWRLWLLNEHGIYNFSFGNNLVSIWCEKRENVDAPLKIHGYTSSPFTLRLYVGNRTHTLHLRRGRIRLELNPTEWQEG